MLMYIRIIIRIISMEMRRVVEVVRQWYQEEAWYVRKGIEKITEDTADLPPVLLPTRPKRNFTIRSIFVKCIVGCSWLLTGDGLNSYILLKNIGCVSQKMAFLQRSHY